MTYSFLNESVNQDKIDLHDINNGLLDPFLFSSITNNFFFLGTKTILG